MVSFNDWCNSHDMQDFLEEWDSVANFPVTPETVSYSSGKKYQWICKKCGNIWLASCNVRSKGHGCRLCGYESARRMKQSELINTVNSLEGNNPELLVDWDYENNSVLPSEITSGSNKNVHWKCHVCGTKWIAPPVRRTYHNSGCPGCTGRVVVPGITDIFSVKPYLKDMWDFDRNHDIDPHMEMKHSKKTAFWICPICGKSYNKQIRVVAGHGKKYCDNCQKQFQTSFPEQALFYYLKNVYPDTKNRFVDLGFELDVYIPSIKVAVEYDGLAWHNKAESVTRDNEKNDSCVKLGIKVIRVREEGLPPLNGNCHEIRIIPGSDESLNLVINQIADQLGINIDCDVGRDFSLIMKSYKRQIRACSLGAVRPDLAREFDCEKNGITPWDIAANVNRRFWWKCPRGHAGYQATPNNRNRGSGCPVCGRQKQLYTLHNNVIEQNGLFAQDFPDLLAEINNTKLASPLNLDKLQSKDGKIKIPWKCSKCGFEWETTVYQRTVWNSGCPSCAHRAVASKRHYARMKAEKSSLMEKFPDIAAEWNYTRNGEASPKEIAFSSNKKVWWICPHCNHEYLATVNSRTNRRLFSGCPKCKARKTGERSRKAVMNIDTGQVFESVKAANEYYGKKYSNISAACRGEREVALGYHWKYLD